MRFVSFSNRGGVRYVYRQSKGTAFINRVFQKFLKEHDIHFFTTYNEETKASIVESFNRTLKTKMWKYFTHRETLPYVDVLSEMVASYNHTVHRTLRPFFLFFKMGSILYTSSVLMTFCNSSA